MFRNWFWLLAASGCTPADGLLSPEPVGSSHVGRLGTDLVWTHRPRVADVEAGWEGTGGGLRAWLLPDRVVAVDRLEAEPSWAVTLTTVGWGRGRDLLPVGAGRTVAQGPRFESRRPDLTEWFETTPDGLEQGWTLHHPPPGPGPVAIELSVEGGRVQATRGGARIRSGSGGIDWTGLVAWDADGHPLPASLGTDVQSLRIEVDDAGARWPITVDPLISVVDDTLSSIELDPGFDSWLGYSLDSESDRLILGDPGNPNLDTDGEGIARVLRPSVAAGGWQNDDRLNPTIDPSDGGEDFGQAVAIEGMHAVLAGPNANVYFFRNTETGWEERAVATNGPTSGPVAVDLADEVAVVGLPESGGVGAIILYTPYPQPVPVWHSFQTINAPGNAAGSLGYSVSATSGRFVAGDPGLEEARVYRRDTDQDDPSDDFYYETAVLDPPNGTPGEEFGYAVAMTPTRIAVGAPGDDRVFVYTLVTGAFAPSAGVVADDWGTPAVVDAPEWASDRFGSSVALHGNTLVVSDLPSDGDARVYRYEYAEPGEWQIREAFEMGRTPGVVPIPVTVNAGLIAAGTPERLDDEGAALAPRVKVWRRTVEDVSPDQTLALSPGTEHGASLAMDDRTLVVGGPKAELFGIRGQVAIHRRTWDGTFVATELLFGFGTGSDFGSAVALDGERVLIGAPDAIDDAGNPNGEVYLYRTTGGILQHEYTLSSDGTSSNFGEAVGLDGTLAVIGQPGYAGEGRAIIYGYAPLFDIWNIVDTLEGALPDDRFGETVAVAAGRLFIGSGSADRAGLANNGVLKVMTLVHDEFPVRIENLQTLEGLAAGDRFGCAVAVDGDLLAVGAKGVANEGEVVMYEWGSVNYVERQRIAPNLAPGSDFGATVALAGGRLYVGAPGNDKVYVYTRDPAIQSNWLLLDSYASHTDVVVAADDVMVTSDIANATVQTWTLEAEGQPKTREDTFTIDEDTIGSIPGNVLANDTDPDGDVLEVLDVEGSGLAELEIDADGDLTYTAAPDAVGVQEFTYTITDGTTEVEGSVVITVENVNDAPVAEPDPDPTIGTYETDENIALVVPAGRGVLYNDSDIDVGTDLEAFVRSPLTPASEGTLTLARDGSFVFVPAEDYIGPSGFWYRANDGSGASNATSADVWVDIVVNASNVAPVALDENIDLGSVAEFDQLSLGRPGLLAPEYVTDDDLDEGDVLRVELVTAPTLGSIRLEPTGEVLYTPHGPGEEEFEYRVLDLEGEPSDVIEVHIQVTDEPDPPYAWPDRDYTTEEDVPLEISGDYLVLNDTDVDSTDLHVGLDGSVAPLLGTVAVNPDNDIVYTPNADASGVDTLAYVAIDSDGNRSNPVVLTVTVIGVNDAPVVVDQDLGVIESTVTGNVFAPGVVDVEGHTLTATLLSAPAPQKGSVTSFDPVTGAFTYEPFAGASKSDQFLFVVTDALGAVSAPGTIRLYVNDSEDPGQTIDEPEPCEIVTWYLDSDGDGFGNPGVAYDDCTVPEHFVGQAGDCDDSVAERFPGATEIPGDRLDQDCDGRDNLAVPAVACATTSADGSFVLLLLTLLGLRRRSSA